MNVLFRNESCYGSGIRDAVEVITFEICELRNTDILDYCLSHYKLQRHHFRETLKVLKKMVEGIDILDEKCVRIVAEDLLKYIENETSVCVKYALWLATKESVMANYEGNDENIDAYEIGPVVLSNLGEEGILFGYSKLPLKK